MIYSIKGFGKIEKDKYGDFTFVNRFVDLLHNIYQYCSVELLLW